MRMISRAASTGEVGAGVAQGLVGGQGRHGIHCVEGGDLIAHSSMANRLLGVISALPEEFAHLSDRSGEAREIGGLAFWRGEIAGREAVFVEFGAGKVNAGVATALLLDRFDCRRADAVRRGGRSRSGAGRRRRRDRHQQHPARLWRGEGGQVRPYPARQPAVARGRLGAWLSRVRTAGGAPARGAERTGAGAVAAGDRRRPAHADRSFRRDPDRRQLRQFRAHAALPARAVRGARRRDGGRRGGADRRGAGATTFQPSMSAASAISPAPRAISISAPSCRSPRAMPRRSRTAWRR